MCNGDVNASYPRYDLILETPPERNEYLRLSMAATDKDPDMCVESTRKPPKMHELRHWDPSSDGGRVAGRSKLSFFASTSAIL